MTTRTHDEHGRIARDGVDTAALAAFIESRLEYREDGYPRRRRRFLNGRALYQDDARVIRRWRSGRAKTAQVAAAERLLDSYGLTLADVLAEFPGAARRTSDRPAVQNSRDATTPQPPARPSQERTEAKPAFRCPFAAPVERIAYNQREAAAKLNMSVNTFKASVKPHIKASYVGGKTLFSHAELERFLERVSG